jgi:hypothetical protein
MYGADSEFSIGTRVEPLETLEFGPISVIQTLVFHERKDDDFPLCDATTQKRKGPFAIRFSPAIPFFVNDTSRSDSIAGG